MLSVEPLKAYDDNYIWLVSTNEGSIVVDPGESNKIIDLMNKNKTIKDYGDKWKNHIGEIENLMKWNKIEPDQKFI